MTITRVKMKKVDNSGKLKAIAEVTIDGILVIHNIKVIDRDENGNYIIGMPSKNSPHKFVDVAHPISSPCRSYFENIILDTFYELNNSNDKTILRETSNEISSVNRSLATAQDKEIFVITSIWMRKINANKLKGLASIVLDAEFAVHDIKLIIDDNTSKRFLAMPCEKKGGNIRDKDIIHPINSELRDRLGQLLFAIYDRAAEEENRDIVLFVASNNTNSILNQTSQDFNITDPPELPHADATENAKTRQLVSLTTEKSAKDISKKEPIKDPVIPFAKDNLEVIDRHLPIPSSFIKGKIVGMLNRDYYLIKLSNNSVGLVESREFDTLYKMIDYKKRVIKEFQFNEDPIVRFDSRIQLMLGKHYYFEQTEISYSNLPLYSIKNLRYVYLDTIVNDKLITNGVILDINKEYTVICLDYGWTFITRTSRIFPSYDTSYVLSRFLGANISINIFYNEEKNIIYPVVANIYSHWTKDNLFVFPVLNNYDGILESKLALDHNLRFIDRNNKFVSKDVGKYFVVKKMRFKSESIRYKANIAKILSRNMEFIDKQLLCVVDIKNLIGFNINHAIQYLLDKNILFTFMYDYSWYYEEDTVSRMLPEVNNIAIIPQNLVVQLTVSKGKRKEYVIPNYAGREIDEVIMELKMHQINVRYTIHNTPIQDCLGDGYVTGSRPDEGSRLFSNDRIMLYLYKRQTNHSPFRVFENETLQRANVAQVAGTEMDYFYFSNTEWKKIIVDLILKHKVITTYHIKIFIFDIFQYSVDEQEFNNALDYLLKKSFVGCVLTKADNLFKGKHRYYYPSNGLYSYCKNNYIDTKRFNIKNWDAVAFKKRASENQAYIKLVQVFSQKYRMEYYVDKLQNFIFREKKELLRIHFWINLLNDRERKVFIIESLRFFEFDREADLTSKFSRYNDFFSEQYNIIPTIIIVFEDREHAEFFFESFGQVFSKSKYNVFYTYDELTISTEVDFNKVFVKYKEVLQ